MKTQTSEKNNHVKTKQKKKQNKNKKTKKNKKKQTKKHLLEPLDFHRKKIAPITFVI